ncbi:hypothetical protein Zmor_011840 [Zophobas morio]|uniref:Uncharacterized protein n=1 Tax=Zophobas morio TaxID=2755281 RepID=A0AA38HGX6_9CUCU|nr:hypothetical protein Zmor_011840 [Zophobas morio]
MDDTKTSTSSFKTDELGQTIDNVKIKNDQISIIKNPNANFFVAPKEKSAVKKVISNLPNSINVIENDEVEASALPKNILELRKVDYAHEQDLKDKVLEKLSIKLEKEVESSAEERRKSRRNKSDFMNINIEETTTEDFDITDTNNFDLPASSSKEKRIDPSSLVDPVALQKEINNPNLVDPGTSRQSNVQSQQQHANQTVSNPTSDGTGFFDVDVHDITAVLKKTSDQNIKTMENKNIARNINIPVINNEDFTISNTVNDLNKQVNNFSTNQVVLENSLDNTTVLVNNLLSEMNKVNQKRTEPENANFDDFYD